MSKHHQPIRFSTYEQMLTKLRSKGISVENQELAIEMLKTRGYYNLINRYKHDFTQSDTDRFTPGLHLADLFYYHRIEDELTTILFKVTISFEQRLKEAMAYTLASDFGLTVDEYLRPENFRNRRRRQNGAEFIHRQLDLCTDNPTAYYKREYHQVPPWILLNNLSLGQTRMLFSIFAKRQTQAVVDQLLPHQPESLGKLPTTLIGLNEENAASLIEMFRNMLSIIRDFRNQFAHGHRVIGFESKQRLTYKTISQFANPKIATHQEFIDSGLGRNDLMALIVSLMLLMHKLDSIYLIDQLAAWEDENTKVQDRKHAFQRFIKSCGLPLDFVDRLKALLNLPD